MFSRSKKCVYMRKSISAQSCDSVPPAPGWIDMRHAQASSGPFSIFLNSIFSTRDLSSAISDSMVAVRSADSSALLIS